ncbi:uncharacterized protein LOC101849740 [Aplysia californica]|uniref:Uncharacterized protein LOC101849740 n=1 Tax=Aplysia californica TaxID=6500 RepID=A0ABM0JBM1_APLCA|nr:uncharacterized protein LOC101849740 [Aplysia californica]
MQEMEEKRRIRGDSHWSKLLQVNSDPNGFRHKRCIRMCRSFNVSQPAICRGLRLGSRRGTDRNGALREIEETTDTSCPPPDSGILASIATRIRHWLQSKRKYEVVSPVNDTSGSGERKGDKSGGDIDHGVAGASGMVRGETIKEDYLIISQINNYHPELKRSGGSNPLGLPVSGPCVPRSASTGVARTSGGSLTPPTVISRHATPTHTSSGGTSSFYPSPGTSSKSTTGHHQQYHTQQHQNSHQHPVVDINIEFADAVAVKPRSHFASNPLKLDQNQTPKTAIMTPATRALSRSQQLRQSRNKYMKLLQKAGQLSPGRTPLTGTISAPAKHGIGEKGSSPIAKRRQIKTWPLPGRKQLKSG